MAFAGSTSVPVERSRAEIERMIVTKHKCDSYQSGIDYVNKTAIVQFKAHNRFVRFVVQLPNPDDKKFRAPRRGSYGLLAVTDSAVTQRVDQANRTIWRSLLLVIKAKLEAVGSNIASFEEEFLAQIVMPNDQTVGTLLLPVVALAYETGMMPSDRMLPAAGETT